MRTCGPLLVSVLVTLTSNAIAQSQPMAFETVSMVASTATPQQRQWLFGSWKVNIIGQPLFDLIENAYELKSGHLIAPDWMRTATYDISGIVPDNSQAYAPQMLRKVLEDK